jgi:hypothetical protein
MLWTASLNYWGWELELELGWRLSATKLDQHKGDARPTPSRPRLDAYLFELGCTTITKVKKGLAKQDSCKFRGPSVSSGFLKNNSGPLMLH